MGFAERFQAGSNAAKGILDTYEKAKQQAEFDKIMQAKAEQSQEMTPEQAAALGQAVAAGGIPQFNEGQGYTVTQPLPDGQQGPVEPQNFAMQGVTNFLGQSTPGTMNESQINNARMRAMSGVISKTDPLTGMRMANDVTQAERADTRFGQETEMFNLNKSAAVRAAEKDKLEMAKAAAGQHIQDVLKKNGGDVRKTAAQIMTETNAGGLEGVKVDYEVGRDGRGYFAKTLPDGTRDVGQPIEPGAQGDLSVWQGIIGGISDPKTVMSWYTDKLTRERDDQKIKAEQGNKDREYGLHANADSRAAALLPGQIAQTAASTAHSQASTGVLNQTVKDKKEQAGLHKEYGDALESGDAAAMDKAAKKLHAYNRSGKGGDTASAFAQKVDFVMRANPGMTLMAAYDKANEKATSQPGEVYDTYAKPGAMGIPNPKDVDEALARRDAFIAARSGVKASTAPVAEFASPVDAEAAVKAGKIKAGDRVKIAGRVAVWKP